MQILRSLQSNMNEPTVLALGCFDALHVAHTQIIEYAVELARINNMIPLVYTFDTRPKRILSKSNSAKSILTYSAKCKLLQAMGVEVTYFADFADICDMTPREFAVTLKKMFNVAYVVVGFDNRFGHNAAGDVNMLRAFGKEMGFDVKVFDAVKKSDVLVSSTHIRTLIAEGKIEEAAQFLGRSFFVEGSVKSDRGVGKGMGIPTINLEPSSDIVLPKFGVYATIVQIGMDRYKGVTNIGVRPTFNLSEITIETFVLDFEQDIYGEEVRVEFVTRIRDEKKFNTVTELREQIFSDIDKARCVLSK